MNSSLRDPKLAQALGETRLGRVLINAQSRSGDEAEILG